jgi:hypothetical protein
MIEIIFILHGVILILGIIVLVKLIYELFN